MRSADPGAARPRPASTVALLREVPGGVEVLLTHRPATMAFGAGLHVFPGGAVDPEDGEGTALAARSALGPVGCAAAWAGDLAPQAAIGHAVAAIRELYEEAGVLLATHRDGSPVAPGIVDEALARGVGLAALAERLDLVLRTDRLVPLSHWVTPPVGVPRRYDTRFYVAALADATGIRHHDREVAAHEWIAPAAALEAYADGRIDLWAPTSTTLAQLASARGLVDVRAHLAPLAAASGPVTEALDEAISRVRVFGAGGIPGLAVNTYVVGRRRMVVVDPGDPSEVALDAILAVAGARGAVIVAVLLTAPVPDHAGGALVLAERLGVPVLAGAAVTAGAAPARAHRAAVRAHRAHGTGGAVDASALVAGPVTGLSDGEEMTLGDVSLRALATPGTHPGHLAFVAASVDAVLVGDVEGPGASRGIPVPEHADAGALGQSRVKVQVVGAARRLPAHG